MRISDWSSDVCSSDLAAGLLLSPPFEAAASPQGGSETCWRPVAKGKSDVGGLMIVGRIIGWFLLFCALVSLGWDAVSSLSSGTWGFAVLGQRWYEIDQALGGASLHTLQAGIERNVSVGLCDNVVALVLMWPAVLLFLVLCPD